MVECPVDFVEYERVNGWSAKVQYVALDEVRRDQLSWR